ncbi:M20 metallopeptidase family protein [Sphingobacterium rhinopitheci]|uniref:M20 metallopeptidase family protein n=1 Tax=Sphingobacterium rhinopitheci TaxID=2781960 RepID=UPI001F526F9B|nr:amidohydrolase [Sphingobacterium rhinopitheci]
MMDVNAIKVLVKEVKEEAIRLRRHFHKHPELSFQEYLTSKYIKEYLTALNISFDSVADTGVIARISGKQTDAAKTIVLRADIDALPIQEINNSDFDSIYPHVMHACGHDFHTANLLAVVKILNEHNQDFTGTIIAVFQPAEEKIPGGAKAIIESGVLNSSISAVLGLHVSPKFEVGKVALRLGKFMASADEFFVHIKGKGGHGAQPHLNIDPVVIASQLVISLQQLVSRCANPAIPTVLSVGKFIANGATNVIPDEVYLEGTFRTMDEQWREQAIVLIEKQLNELPQIYGASADVEIRRGYPVLHNDADLAVKVRCYLNEFLGEEAVEEAPVWMAAEDFSYYTQHFPSLFFLVGIANTQKGISAELHTPNFQIDEDAFEYAIGAMLYSALRLLC